MLLSWADCARLPTEVVSAAAGADFEALVRVAIADAIRDLPDTTAWLRSPDIHLDWLDALLFAEGDLQVTVEQMAYDGDPHLVASRARLKKVRRALDRARSLAGQYRHQARRTRDAHDHHDAVHVAQRWLRHHFADEADQIRDELCRRAGLPFHAPDRPTTVDGLHAIELAAEQSTPALPPDHPAAVLLVAAREPFLAIVEADIRQQKSRNQALRHPLVLRRWRQALEALLDDCQPRAHAASPRRLGALEVDLRTLEPDRARRVLRSRRFFTAALQRLAEFEQVVRRLHLEAEQHDHERQRPWAEIESKTRAELARRRRDEHAFLLRSLHPYGVEFASPRLDPRWCDDTNRWAAVRRQALTALAEGTWTTAVPSSRPAGAAQDDADTARRNAYLRRQVLAGTLTPRQAQSFRERDNRRRRAKEPTLGDENGQIRCHWEV
ncbi:hypothetical protein [Kitasatospora sp. NPDC058046]|uniref:hypothetical protein n=1 Tax=Kitasatospora sp. NPDC058046 TaxID=3346312 RepID=UPI0036DDE93B